MEREPRETEARRPLKPILAIIAFILATQAPIDYQLLTSDTKTQQNTVLAVEQAIFGTYSPLTAVSMCESSLRQFDGQSPLKSHTDDIGAMQINSIHIPEAEKLGWDIHTLVGNLMYAKYLYEREGLKPWASSAPCWKSKVELALVE